VTGKKPLEWYSNGWGGIYPACMDCRDAHTVSLRSALASVATEQGVDTDAVTFIHFEELHARGHQ
jgi:hypothetical protein